jgi:hypothetical protein
MSIFDLCNFPHLIILKQHPHPQHPQRAPPVKNEIEKHNITVPTTNKKTAKTAKTTPTIIPTLSAESLIIMAAL